MPPKKFISPVNRVVSTHDTTNRPALMSSRIVVVKLTCAPAFLIRSSRSSLRPAVIGKSFLQ